MNIDLDKIGKLTEADLEDKQTLKRLAQYVYQLTEQLKYWQYNLEAENFSGETQVLMQRMDALAKQLKVNEESGDMVVETPSGIEGVDATMTGTNSATLTGGGRVTVQSGNQMNIQAAYNMALSANELVLTGYQLLRLIASSVLKIEGVSEESFIRLAYSAAGPKFMVNGQGNLTAKTGDFEELYVGGQTIASLMDVYRDRQIEISTEQPTRTGVIWIKPSREVRPVEKNIYYTGYSISGTTMNEQTNTRTVQLRCPDSGISRNVNVDYGVGIRILNEGESTDRLTGITVTITGTNAATYATETLTVLSENLVSNPRRISPGGYASWSVETLTTTGASNLTSAQTMTMTITVTYEEAGTRSIRANAVQLKVHGVEGQYAPESDPLTCQVFYIPEAEE